MIYHLLRRKGHGGAAACVVGGLGTVAPDDELVPEAEAKDPDGRHFNCPMCDKALHFGRAHAKPPEEPS